MVILPLGSIEVYLVHHESKDASVSFYVKKIKIGEIGFDVCKLLGGLP